MSVPTVSVVMSVYNGERHLRESVESVLGQEYGDFELLIVNDGSTDGSRDILAQYARQDGRLRIIDQENQGLTRALIRACAEARAPYIARQDADDVSLPGRLARQVAFLEGHRDVTLLSCWTEFVGPENEVLFAVERRERAAEATRSLRAGARAELKGIPGHGTAFFRRSDYERAGGYRPQFYFAQDLDLWMRLTDFGLVAFVPEVLYRARIDPDAISGRHAAAQRELARIIVELKTQRERGGEDAALLERAAQIGPAHGPRTTRGGGHYFIGRLLQRRQDPRGAKYLRLALEANPFHWRARIALALDAWWSR